MATSIAARDRSEVIAGIRALFDGVSIETSAKDRAGLEAATPHLTPGSDFFVTWMPNDTAERRLEACKAVRDAGFTPVPHIAVRFVESRDQLDQILGGLVEGAGVRKVLTIGGELDAPRGPYGQALDVIASGALKAAGIQDVCIGFYPEGHPKVSDSDLRTAFNAKAAAAKEQGLNVTGVSQMAFEAKPYLDIISQIRGDGHTFPLRLGVAGPAGLPTLIKFAAMCGVGASMKALTTRSSTITKLLTEAGPDPVIRGLAESPALPDLGALALHFFVFGGAEKTAKWMRAAREGRITLEPKGDGFSVEKL